MVARNVPHMNKGDGDTSYAKNSFYPRTVASASLFILEESIRVMFGGDNDGLFPKCLRIVDFGCSSGENTFFTISHIMDIITELYDQKRNDSGFDEWPEFEVFLNDLPGNDFNNLFKLLPTFTHKARERSFWYGLPSSFYQSLCMDKSIHFAFSCYSLHWLSQVPSGLENKNKENICIEKTSPIEVIEAYANQYQRDFSTFLKLRGKEMVEGGHMVFIILGRRTENHSCEDDTAQFTLLADTLADMVAEGLVKRDDLYSFNVPIYFPCKREVEKEIHDEGSFDLHKLHIVPVHFDTSGGVDADQANKDRCGKQVANCVRSFIEPLLITHFGISIIDEVFERYAKKAAEQPLLHNIQYWNIVVSLCKI